MSKNKLENLKDSNKINNCLKKVEEEYRPNSAANYLYKQILKEYEDNKYINIKEHCYTDSFIELLWATLDAWNMNSRGAQLVDINDFKTNLNNCSKYIESLKGCSIEDLSNGDDKSEDIFKQLGFLFTNLELTKTKTKIVTFSKTMHFLLPNLIVPIDRKYTLKFFGRNVYINTEFSLFKDIESAFGLFASEVNLDGFVINNSQWCKYKTKIIDNIIIGYEKIA